MPLKLKRERVYHVCPAECDYSRADCRDNHEALATHRCQLQSPLALYHQRTRHTSLVARWPMRRSRALR